MGMLLLNGSSEFGVRRELFSNNEQGLWLDPSDMTAGKAGWRRNLLSYTEQFDNSYWTKQQSTCVANSANSPFGDQTADLVYPSGDTSFQGLARTAGATFQRLPHRFSIYAKASGKNWLYFFNINFVGGNGGVWFDLQAGTVGAVTGAWSNATIESVGNGWYRCSATATPGGTNDYIYFLAGDNNNSANCTPNATDGLLLYGAQLELGSLSEYQKITDFSTEFKSAFPTHTLYQDSNGVTPCTAAGDPVGLILDQSRGGLGALGAEQSNTSSINGVPAGGGSDTYYPTVATLTPGKWYRVTFVISGYSGTGTLGLLAGTGTDAFLTNTQYASNQTVTFIGVCQAGGLVRFFTRNSNTANFSNISVRELPGNHAYQTTSASRPTLARIPSSGRRNLLTRTEELDNAAWAKLNATATANATTAPDGTPTAEKIFENSTGNVERVVYPPSPPTVTATAHTFSIYAKASENIWVYVRCDNGTSSGAWFNLQTGAVGTVEAGISAAITNAGNGWYRCSVTKTLSAGTGYGAFQLANADNVKSYVGVVNNGIFAWGAQLETGSTATNYQKVVATTDVTESGVSDLWHLVFDGSDDSLVCNSVDFTSVTEGPTRNLVRSSENFSAPWTTGGVASATYNNLGPEGRFNATTFTVLAAGGQTHIQQGFNYTPSQTHVLTFWMKAGTATTASIGFWVGAGFISQTGTVLSGPGSISGTTLLAISGLSVSEWTKFQITFTAPSSGVLELYFYGETSGIKTGLSQSMAQFQLEVGSTPTAYQPTGTDEMTVIAGVRKLSDAASAAFVEASADAGSNSGAFAVYAPRIANAAVEYRSRGTLTVTANEGIASAAPTTLVFTGQSDISDDSLTVRKNGVQAGSSAGDQGSGNYGNYQLFIGRRNQATLPFNGHLYQLIIRGKTTPTGKLLEAERFVAKRTGVTGI